MVSACDDDRSGRRGDVPSVATEGDGGLAPADLPATDEWTGCTGQCARCRYRAPCEAGVPIDAGR